MDYELQMVNRCYMISSRTTGRGCYSEIYVSESNEQV